MTPFNTTEQLAALNKANLESLAAIANSTVARAEHLIALNLNTTCAMLEDGVVTTKTLMAAKDAQDLATLQAKLTQPKIDNAVAYARSVYEIAAEGQREFAKLFEGQFAELNKNVNIAIQQAVKSVPAGSEAMFAAIKSSVEAANSLCDSATKGRQAGHRTKHRCADHDGRGRLRQEGCVMPHRAMD